MKRFFVAVAGSLLAVMLVGCGIGKDTEDVLPHRELIVGKDIVAEGAETAESVALLTEANCDHIQGYFFSRPLPAKDFLRFLKEHLPGDSK